MTTIVGILVVICVDIINLKNKAAKLFYQEKWVYSGIAENCNLGYASYSKKHRLMQQTKERIVIL